MRISLFKSLANLGLENSTPKVPEPEKSLDKGVNYEGHFQAEKWFLSKGFRCVISGVHFQRDTQSGVPCLLRDHYEVFSIGRPPNS